MWNASIQSVPLSSPDSSWAPASHHQWQCAARLSLSVTLEIGHWSGHSARLPLVGHLFRHPSSAHFGATEAFMECLKRRHVIRGMPAVKVSAINVCPSAPMPRCQRRKSLMPTVGHFSPRSWHSPNPLTKSWHHSRTCWTDTTSAPYTAIIPLWIFTRCVIFWPQ